MKTSDLFKMNIAKLYSMRRDTWDAIKLLRANDTVDMKELRKVTTDMAYIQKAIEDRTDDGEIEEEHAAV